jgi:hypothetical protein
MTHSEQAYFSRLLDKVIAAGDTSTLSATEKAHYHRLCELWDNDNFVAPSSQNLSCFV